VALNWLVDNELGLTEDVSSLTYREREAIKFVHSYTRMWDDKCRDEVKALTGKM
jgi:hypothetical protein